MFLRVDITNSYAKSLIVIKKLIKDVLESIKEVRKNKHKKTYGAPRMKEELNDKYGVKVLKRITRL